MRKRCVIYTRKSTDEGLDQSFNSLDAQREACAAFIKSQNHEDWTLVSKHFDDGGFSGGTTNRPALQALLAEVKARKIDIIVVYKIDRLTRSLLDFAKIVEILDMHAVSFVSVTQQFNTTTSMGRLMLNVLLSFAQFEREVTGERIRDKIAASKRKGMWMGGNPPLGYDVKDRRLVINEMEAEIVRKLFAAYRELGTVRRLKFWADSQGILTKRRSKVGVAIGGKPFSRGNLYALLSNCLYKGTVSHGKQHHKGQHESIIDAAPWEQVNMALRAKSARRKSDTNNHSASLLAGRLFDETGDRLSPTYAVKGNKRYRYYISRRLMTGEGDCASGWRLPANAIENAIAEAVRDFLTDRTRLSGEVGSLVSVHALNAVLARAAGVAASQRESAGKEDLLSLVHRTVVHDDRLKITLDRSALLNLLGNKEDTDYAEPISLDLPMRLQRRGVQVKLVIPSLTDADRSFDPNLVRTIAAAFAWFDEIASGQISSLQDLAARERLPASEVSRLLPLAFLSPSVVAALFAGQQPPQLTAERLKRLPGLPPGWADQRKSLGFQKRL
jgi:site-specific DNA recombinase